ncbi:MAG: ribosomal protein S18-alanine N-acetyltransferase [Porticoccaceae bacterium]|nr:ribosomal protein S18-alanine N-acetyltransferase [Porticoccaceae bacterium]
MLDQIKQLLGMGEKPPIYLRPLKERDIPDVMAIEKQMYNYPWSEGIFKDCLSIGYYNWAFIKDDVFIGYAILSIAVGEAHLLNICIDPAYQRQGLGRYFVDELILVVREKNADCLFLEVRPSNTVAVNLYKKIGFKQIGQRKDYYPTENGREDAVVLSYEMPEDVA